MSLAFENGPYFEWWDKSGAATYAGLEASLRYLARINATHGPFEGVLGFSQGAGLAALCSAMKNQRDKGKSLANDAAALLPPAYGGVPLPALR